MIQSSLNGLQNNFKKSNQLISKIHKFQIDLMIIKATEIVNYQGY